MGIFINFKQNVIVSMFPNTIYLFIGAKTLQKPENNLLFAKQQKTRFFILMEIVH